MKNAECRVENVVRAVCLSMLMIACAGATSQTSQTFQSSQTSTNSFDVVALVDSLDFAMIYDIETETGRVQVLEHVLLTHANDIWWRDKGGGQMRFPSTCEMWPFAESPFDKRRLPNEDVYGHLRQGSPRGNEFPTVRAECRKRGLGFGIHTTLEENHWCSTLASTWTLAHPQYWGCTRDGDPWMGCCSIMHPEVVAHKLEMVDERLALKPQKIMLDFWRNGDWTYSREYTAPALAEWKRLHGNGSPPAASDPRWQKMVGAHFDDYLRKFSAKCRAAGVEFIVGVPYVDDRDDAELRSRYSGFAWRHLAKEGVLDAIYVMSVVFDRKDPFGSTERIYRDVMANCGKAKVYFPVSSYNMQQCGIGEYAKLANISAAEATKRLMLLARKVGARGIVLECVDYMNYSPAMCAAIAEAMK